MLHLVWLTVHVQDRLHMKRVNVYMALVVGLCPKSKLLDESTVNTLLYHRQKGKGKKITLEVRLT